MEQDEQQPAAAEDPGKRAEAADGDEVDGTSDMDADDVDDEADADQQDLEEDDPAELRRRLDSEQAMVRMLVREGVNDEHPAMVAAVAARDAAEEAWRSTRRPHPVARRMGWAQQGLDRAMRARDRVREELAQFDEQTKEQRAQIAERLGQAMDRVSKRQRALDELQEEAATEVPASRRGRGIAEICSKLAGGMRTLVAPHVAALASKLPEGSEAQEQFNLLVAKLEGLQGELDQHAAVSNQAHEEYCIADGQSEAEWSESHDLPGAGTRDGNNGNAEQGARVDLPRWRSKGHGRWNKDGEETARRTGKGTGHTDKPPAAAAPSALAADAAPRTTATSTLRPMAAWAGEGGDEVAATARSAQPKPGTGGDARGGRQDDGAPPPNKLHKGQATLDSGNAQAALSDTSRAMELMQAQQGAAAAGEFGSQAAIQAAAQLHSRNVDRVAKAAISQGIQPVTSAGEELIMLGPQELAQWASEKLDTAEGQWW